MVTGTQPNGEMILFDVFGKEILRQKSFASETRIKSEKLLPGVYLLSYVSGNKRENIMVIRCEAN